MTSNRHVPLYHAKAPARDAQILRFTAAVLVGAALGGCSISLPLMSLHPDDDVTGSISRPAGPLAPLSPRLTDEDVRRAQAALAVAVDPQGSGTPVGWDNPDTKVKGSFAAAGPLYLRDDRVCRSFVASIGGAEPEMWHQGQACRLSPGEWAIRELKPWKKPI